MTITKKIRQNGEDHVWGGGRTYVGRVILARVGKRFKEEKAVTMKKIWKNGFRQSIHTAHLKTVEQK